LRAAVIRDRVQSPRGVAADDLAMDSIFSC